MADNEEQTPAEHFLELLSLAVYGEVQAKINAMRIANVERHDYFLPRGTSTQPTPQTHLDLIPLAAQEVQVKGWIASFFPSPSQATPTLFRVTIGSLVLELNPQGPGVVADDTFLLWEPGQPLSLDIQGADPANVAKASLWVYGTQQPRLGRYT